MKILCSVLSFTTIIFAIVARIISTRKDDAKLTGILFLINCGVCLVYALVTILGFWSDASLVMIAISLIVCALIWVKRYRNEIIIVSIPLMMLIIACNIYLYEKKCNLSDEVHITTEKYDLYEEDKEFGKVILVSYEEESEYYYFYEGAEKEVCINKIPLEDTTVSYISSGEKPHVVKTVETQYYFDENYNPPVQLERKEEKISYVIYITEDALKLANFVE